MNKLVVVIIGQDCERFLPMCIDSVKGVDKIVYCDGGSKDKSLEIADEMGCEIISNKYDKQDKGMNGRQRNFYLNYLKKDCPDCWALCLDADEVVEDINQIKELINRFPQTVLSVKMRHLIGDLGHEDSTVEEHYVLNRLFHIDSADKYPEVEHPVLEGKKGTQYTQTKCTTIWHLAYVPNIWDIKKRYENHMQKSNMHTPEFLKWWYYSHLFGQYPKKQFNPVELPRRILNEFGIEKDEIYFQNRGLETKHFVDAIHWRDYFKPNKVLEVGCGKGPRVFALNNIGVNTIGIELSQWAVDHAMLKEHIIQGDITDKDLNQSIVDLVITYDVLEHLEPTDLDKAIDNLTKISKKYILISVPVIGDPNLENDPTHKIKETKEWWINKFENKGCKHIDTPEHFLFKEQVLIFEVKHE